MQYQVRERDTRKHGALEKGPNAKNVARVYIPHELLHSVRGLVTEMKDFSDEIVR